MLRLGRWQDVLTDITPDAILTSVPGSVSERDRALETWPYPPMDESEITEFAEFWLPRCAGAIVVGVCAGHLELWKEALGTAHHVSLYGKLAPRYFVVKNATPTGDYTTMLRPGFGGGRGGMSLGTMRTIVTDFTDPGDLICDPYAGLGTTFLAAAPDRNCVGAECCPETHAKAEARLWVI